MLEVVLGVCVGVWTPVFEGCEVCESLDVEEAVLEGLEDTVEEEVSVAVLLCVEDAVAILENGAV